MGNMPGAGGKPVEIIRTSRRHKPANRKPVAKIARFCIASTSSERVIGRSFSGPRRYHSWLWELINPLIQCVVKLFADTIGYRVINNDGAII